MPELRLGGITHNRMDNPFNCLYCNEQLKKKPGSKTKCPYCGKYMCVRKQASGEKLVVTENEANRLDALKTLEQHGITEATYNRQKAALKLKKLGEEPAWQEVIWALYNKLLAKAGTDFHQMHMIYFEMAWFLYNEGQDPYNAMDMARKSELMYNSQSRDTVVIDSGDNCPACQALVGKMYSIQEALDEQPLPCKECTNDPDGKDVSICNCCYL